MRAGTRKRYRIADKQRFTSFILTVVLAIAGISLMVDTIRFPEYYSTTWRYQLEEDIKAGDEKWIDYYKTRYLANGRTLFEEDLANWISE